MVAAHPLTLYGISGDTLLSIAIMPAFNPVIFIGPAAGGKSSVVNALVRHWQGESTGSHCDVPGMDEAPDNVLNDANARRLLVNGGTQMLLVDTLGWCFKYQPWTHDCQTCLTRHGVSEMHQLNFCLVIDGARYPCARKLINEQLLAIASEFDKFQGPLTLQPVSTRLGIHRHDMGISAASKRIHQELTSMAEKAGRIQVLDLIWVDSVSGENIESLGDLLA